MSTSPNDSKIALAIYAGKSYLRERDKVDELAQERWGAPDDSPSNTKWLRTRLRDRDITFGADSPVALLRI